MSASEDHARRRERAQAVALFRYTLIRDAADPQIGSRERGVMVRAIVAAEHRGPFGGPVRVTRPTAGRWIRAWREHGFEGLLPPERQATPRSDPAVLAMARALKAENPGRTAAQVARILRQSAGSAPSERTLQRLFLAADLAGQARKVPATFGRFEASRPNELWTGDALHGPHLNGRKTYLFAFIDDHSRAITGHRFGFAEDTVRLAAALRPALAARGIPDGVYVDNGSAFVDAALLRSCASLGIRLVHSAPGRPQGRGKIERFFRTVRDQFLAGITGTGPGPGGAAEQGRHYAGSLDELNTLFTAWVETVYHRAVHSETGQPPLERYSAGPPARHPAPGELREAFLWSERRKVTKTATVSLHGNAYQVDPLLAGMHVELLFDPFDMTAIEVRHDGAAAGTAIPHVISRHSHPKARPEQPGTPPPATGIDYTAMIAAAHDAALAGELVSYAGLGAGTGTSGQLPGQLTIDQALAEEHA